MLNFERFTKVRFYIFPELSNSLSPRHSRGFTRINNLHNQNTHARIEQGPSVLAWHSRGDNQGQA